MKQSKNLLEEIDINLYKNFYHLLLNKNVIDIVGLIFEDGYYSILFLLEEEDSKNKILLNIKTKDFITFKQVSKKIIEQSNINSMFILEHVDSLVSFLSLSDNKISSYEFRLNKLDLIFNHICNIDNLDKKVKEKLSFSNIFNYHDKYYFVGENSNNTSSFLLYESYSLKTFVLKSEIKIKISKEQKISKPSILLFNKSEGAIIFKLESKKTSRYYYSYIKLNKYKININSFIALDLGDDLDSIKVFEVNTKLVLMGILANKNIESKVNLNNLIIPRLVYQKERRLVFKPFNFINNKYKSSEETKITLDKNKECVLLDEKTYPYHIGLYIKLEKKLKVSLYLMKGENNSFNIDLDNDTLIFTKENATVKDKQLNSYIYLNKLDEYLKIDVFKDNNILEVFVNDGEYSFSNTIFHLKKDSIVSIKSNKNIEFSLKKDIIKI